MFSDGIPVDVDQVGYCKPSSRGSLGGYEMLGVMGNDDSNNQMFATFFFDNWNKDKRNSTSSVRGERVIVPKEEHLVAVPADLPPEVGVSLPYRGLMAYRAVEVASKMIKDNNKFKTAVVIASHGLGLWTYKMALSLIKSAGALRWVMVDVSPMAEEYIQAAYHNEFSTFDLLNWPPNCYEEDLIQKTKNTCPSGVDLVFDFTGNNRTANRLAGMLKENCVVVTVGDSKAWTLPHGGEAASTGFFSECDLACLPIVISMLASGRIQAPKLLPIDKISGSDSDEESLKEGESTENVFSA